MEGKNRTIAGVAALAVAIAMFCISFIDSIELIGKYEVVEADGISAEEAWERNGFDEQPMKVYVIFGITGKLEVDCELTKYGKEEVPDEWIEMFENREEQLNENELTWSVRNGELIVEDKDNDEEAAEYSLGFSTLKLKEDGDDAAVLERTFPMGYICPSMILRLLSILIFIVGLVKVCLHKGTREYMVSRAPGWLCPNCKKSIVVGGTFCGACGFRLIGNNEGYIDNRDENDAYSDMESSSKETESVILKRESSSKETESVILKRESDFEGKSRLKSTFRTSSTSTYEIRTDSTEESTDDAGKTIRPAGDL